jgi:hypothetical protein
MATGDGIYTNFKVGLGGATWNMGSNTFKIILLNDSHTFNAAHVYYSDVIANELAASGNYATGGATIASPAWTAVSTTAKWDATDPYWSSATFSAYFAAIYDDTLASDPLVCSFGFGGVQTVSSGTFTVQFNASGIMVLS